MVTSSLVRKVSSTVRDPGLPMSALASARATPGSKPGPELTRAITRTTWSSPPPVPVATPWPGLAPGDAHLEAEPRARLASNGPGDPGHLAVAHRGVIEVDGALKRRRPSGHAEGTVARRDGVNHRVGGGVDDRHRIGTGVGYVNPGAVGSDGQAEGTAGRSHRRHLGVRRDVDNRPSRTPAGAASAHGRSAAILPRVEVRHRGLRPVESRDEEAADPGPVRRSWHRRCPQAQGRVASLERTPLVPERYEC